MNNKELIIKQITTKVSKQSLIESNDNDKTIKERPTGSKNNDTSRN